MVKRAARWLARAGTLRVRLTAAVALVSAGALAAGSALLVNGVEATVVRAIEDQSRDELHSIGAQLAGGVPARAIHPRTAGRRIHLMRPDGTRVDAQWSNDDAPPEIRVTRPGQGRATHDAPSDVARMPARPPPLPVPAGEAPGAALRFAAVGDGAWSVVDMPVMSPEGPLRAVAYSPLDDVIRSTRTLQHVLLLGGPIIVALLTLAAWLLVGRALAPVRHMAASAADIADATAPERLAVPAARDELAALARTLNDMLDRLALAARRQREFVSDASHELRSPIAATRAQLEVALAHPDRHPPTAIMRGVLAETARLEDLVADLLALARLDERPGHDELDLDDVVFEDAGRARAVPVETRGVDAVKLRGDRKALGHLVRNLLDNAARHASRRVAVATQRDGDSAVLVVDDDGPGIPEADRARVFERFTRLSPGRSRDDGGAGLGLALVRRIAEQHGGRVELSTSPLGGARFEVRLPAAMADEVFRISEDA